MAVAAVEFSYDEAASQLGVLLSDLADFLTQMYSFRSTPEVIQRSTGKALPGVQSFQSGVAILDGQRVAINRLNVAMQAGSIVVLAKNTDVANSILNDVVTKLDEKFGYQIRASEKKRHFQSHIVAEFAPGLEKQLAPLAKIQALLEAEIPGRRYPFALKRVAFGGLDQHLAVEATSPSAVSNTDFSFERRAYEAIESNRYYCVAPVSTSEHERILKLIEQALAG